MTIDIFLSLQNGSLVQIFQQSSTPQQHVTIIKKVKILKKLEKEEEGEGEEEELKEKKKDKKPSTKIQLSRLRRVLKNIQIPYYLKKSEKNMRNSLKTL